MKRLIVMAGSVLWFSSLAVAAQTVEAPLTTAIMSGDLRDVRELLNAGADPNSTEAYGATALRWAVYRDNLDAVRMFVDAGADIRSNAICSQAHD